MPALEQFGILYSQNFLRSPFLVERLLNMCDIGPHDIVYEIGAGKGIITEHLAPRCQQVIAIEKDLQFARFLRSKFATARNVRIAEGDFLRYDLPQKPYKVCANIPFNITTAIVTRLTTVQNPPEDTYLIMQKEAAHRFLGIPQESLYAILLKPTFELEVLYQFRRSDFVPAPRVDVVLLRLRKRGPPLLTRKENFLFRDFVVYSFTNSQSSLRSALKRLFTPHQLKKLSSDLDQNFDTPPTILSFEHWLRLFDSFLRIAQPQALHTIIGSEARLRLQQTKLEKPSRTPTSRGSRRA